VVLALDIRGLPWLAMLTTGRERGRIMVVWPPTLRRITHPGTVAWARAVAREQWRARRMTQADIDWD
jgi:hypothetical protein